MGDERHDIVWLRSCSATISGTMSHGVLLTHELTPSERSDLEQLAARMGCDVTPIRIEGPTPLQQVGWKPRPVLQRYDPRPIGFPPELGERVTFDDTPSRPRGLHANPDAPRSSTEEE